MSEEKETGLGWLKQHADTIVILSSFAMCFWSLNEKIASIEKDMAVVKAVLVMKNLMPQELCKTDKDHE